jgi:hypothetical protein
MNRINARIADGTKVMPEPAESYATVPRRGNMDRAGKERTIQTLPFPWPQYLSLLQESRSARIKAADRREGEQAVIHEDYDLALDRILAAGSRVPGKIPHIRH